MRRVCCTLLTCIAICSGAGGVLREVTYDANNPLLPTFEKGYLLTAEAACTIAVYGPEGQPCSLLSAAADRDGSIAAAISYTSSAAYRAGILQLDRTGHKISFTDTGRYLPSHICFDRERSIWSIGWQRDGIQSDSEDSQDDPILRKYTAGREKGALLARVTMVQGILSRSCIWQAHCYPVRSCPRRVCPAGRGYTSDGQLYARRITRESGHQRDLMTLDRKTGRWIFKRQLPEAPGILLGAEGKHLVFAASVTGPYRVIWISAE